MEAARTDARSCACLNQSSFCSKEKQASTHLQSRTPWHLSADTLKETGDTLAPKFKKQVICDVYSYTDIHTKTAAIRSSVDMLHKEGCRDNTCLEKEISPE